MGEQNEVVVPDEEAALVKSYKAKIERELSRHEDRFKRYQRNREAYRGVLDGKKGKLARTNLIFSTIATIYPQIYAKNPDISLSPAESVDDASYENVKKYGKTAEVILQRMLMREGNMKERAKSWVRATLLCEVGWLKVTYQKDTREDPIIKNRMNDIQDNIERIKTMTTELGDEGGMDADGETAELMLQLQGLAAKVEVVVSSGIVIDKLMTEDLICLDPTIRDFYDYRNSSALAQRTWMDEDKFEATFGREPLSKAQRWTGKSLGQATSTEGTNGKSAASSDKDAEFFAVWEIWDKDANSVLTWCEGEEGWCRAPYQPKTVGRRWYPFFGLCFNPVDGEFYGISDVDLLIELQDEYNETREALREHRKYSIPIRVVRAGGSLTPQDVQNIRDAKYGQTVVIGGDSSVPLRNDVDTLEGPRIDPALYDVQMIRADIEMVSGASDAARGMVMTAKTATEAEIMQSGMASRTAERQDTIEDCIEEMAKYTIEMLTGELTIPEVIRFAGHGAVWPEGGQMDQVFDVLNLEIRAGSSGKPNRNNEREQWIQLMPLIQEAMQKIMDLRSAGANDMADAVVELTRETLHRFDERIDVDAFLPRKKEGEADPAAQMQQTQAQLQQLTDQNQQLQAALQQMQQQLAQAQDANAARMQEFEYKGKQGEADRLNELEKERIRSQGKATADGVSQALSNQEQVLGKLQQLEQAVAQMQAEDAAEQDAPEKDDAAEVKEILAGVQAMIAPLLQKEGSEQEVPPINITVPVTIEGRGATTKQGRMVRNPDGSYSMQMTETGDGEQGC